MTELKRAGAQDAQIIWQMQREAFSELFGKYQDYETSPATEKLERTQQRLTDGSFFYYIIADGEKVGAIRIVQQDNCKRLSPIFIMKQHRGKKYAQAAIKLAEQLHGERGWALETILQEDGNCRLYEKLGYKRTGKVLKINDKMDLISYIKE